MSFIYANMTRVYTLKRIMVSFSFIYFIVDDILLEVSRKEEIKGKVKERIVSRLFQGLVCMKLNQFNL